MARMGTKDEVRKVQIQDAENQTRWQQRPQTGSDGSDKQMRKGLHVPRHRRNVLQVSGRCEEPRRRNLVMRLLNRLWGLWERWHLDFLL